MHVVYAWSNGSDFTFYGPNSQNLIQFSKDANNQFFFEGDLELLINSSLSNYSFNGVLKNNTQGNYIVK